MGKAYAIGLISALAASATASLSSQSHVAYADGPFKFSPFSSSPSGQSQPSNPPPAAESEPPAPPKVRNDNPRTTSAGFDPEALERGAKALREISSSNNAKKVWNFAFKKFFFFFFHYGSCSWFCHFYEVLLMGYAVFV